MMAPPPPPAPPNTEIVDGNRWYLIGDERFLTNNGGTSWFSSPSGTLEKFAVNVTAAPESGSTLAIFGLVVGAMLRVRRKMGI